jgi:hypothetical protein
VKKHKLFICLIVLVLGLPTAEIRAQDKPMVQSPMMQSLQPFKWQKRVVLVFAANAADARWQRQQELLKQADQELTARDLVVLGVLGNQVSAINTRMSNMPKPDLLREQYKIKPDDFTVVLIGKDGTEKYRAQDVIKPGAIFHIVDAMPIRQQEIRRQNQ